MQAAPLNTVQKYSQTNLQAPKKIVIYFLKLKRIAYKIRNK